MKEEYERYVRDKITSLRLEKNISEYRLSLEIGKCKTYIQAITSGKAMPSMDAFLDICEYFNITPEEFFSQAKKDNEQLRRIHRSVSRLKGTDLNLVEQLLDRFPMEGPGGGANG